MKKRKGCGPSIRRGCGDNRNGKLRTYAQIVADYRRHYDDDVARYRAFFGDGSLAPGEAVRRAGLSLRDDGTVHPHQRRLGRLLMAEAAAILTPLAPALMAATNFDELHRTIDLHLRAVGGFGELAIYDIAQRLGWYRNMEPSAIYLHCGTREGAKALGLSTSGRTLALAALPPELRVLSPSQLEDVLCIYKNDLRRIAAPF
jgi:hypothetical protein